MAVVQISTLGGVRALLKAFTKVNVASPHLQPLGGVVVSAMGLTAIYRTLAGKGIVWKGREYKDF